MSQVNIELMSEITCPKCGFSKVEEMPTDACQWFYECTHCGVLLKPLEGDCCVFCSYWHGKMSTYLRGEYDRKTFMLLQTG